MPRPAGAPLRASRAGTGGRGRSPSRPASPGTRARSRLPSWRGRGDLLHRPLAVEQHGAGLAAGREDEEAERVVERVQRRSGGVDEADAEVEPPVGERQAVEAEPQLAEAAAAV